MPATNLEQVQKREAQLKEAIAGLGEAPDVAKKRELGKKLRRAQRLRRRMAVESERTAKAEAKAAAAKAAAAPADGTPADDAPAEKAAE